MKNTEFTEYQKEILIGSILGDGCFKMNRKGINASFDENHSLKQLDYCEWKRQQLLPLANNMTFGKSYGRKKEKGKVL